MTFPTRNRGCSHPETRGPHGIEVTVSPSQDERISNAVAPTGTNESIPRSTSEPVSLNELSLQSEYPVRCVSGGASQAQSVTSCASHGSPGEQDVNVVEIIVHDTTTTATVSMTPPIPRYSNQGQQQRHRPLRRHSIEGEALVLEDIKEEEEDLPSIPPSLSLSSLDHHTLKELHRTTVPTSHITRARRSLSVGDSIPQLAGTTPPWQEAGHGQEMGLGGTRASSRSLHRPSSALAQERPASVIAAEFENPSVGWMHWSLVQETVRYNAQYDQVTLVADDDYCRVLPSKSRLLTERERTSTVPSRRSSRSSLEQQRHRKHAVIGNGPCDNHTTYERAARLTSKSLKKNGSYGSSHFRKSDDGEPSPLVIPISQAKYTRRRRVAMVLLSAMWLTYALADTVLLLSQVEVNYNKNYCLQMSDRDGSATASVLELIFLSLSAVTAIIGIYCCKVLVVQSYRDFFRFSRYALSHNTKLLVLVLVVEGTVVIRGFLAQNRQGLVLMAVAPIITLLVSLALDMFGIRAIHELMTDCVGMVLGLVFLVIRWASQTVITCGVQPRGVSDFVIGALLEKAFIIYSWEVFLVLWGHMRPRHWWVPMTFTLSQRLMCRNVFQDATDDASPMLPFTQGESLVEVNRHDPLQSPVHRSAGHLAHHHIGSKKNNTIVWNTGRLYGSKYFCHVTRPLEFESSLRQEIDEDLSCMVEIDISSRAINGGTNPLFLGKCARLLSSLFLLVNLILAGLAVAGYGMRFDATRFCVDLDVFFSQLPQYHQYIVIVGYVLSLLAVIMVLYVMSRGVTMMSYIRFAYFYLRVSHRAAMVSIATWCMAGIALATAQVPFLSILLGVYLPIQIVFLYPAVDLIYLAARPILRRGMTVLLLGVMILSIRLQFEFIFSCPLRLETPLATLINSSLNALLALCLWELGLYSASHLVSGLWYLPAGLRFDKRRACANVLAALGDPKEQAVLQEVRQRLSRDTSRVTSRSGSPRSWRDIETDNDYVSRGYMHSIAPVVKVLPAPVIKPSDRHLDSSNSNVNKTRAPAHVSPRSRPSAGVVEIDAPVTDASGIKASPRSRGHFYSTQKSMFGGASAHDSRSGGHASAHVYTCDDNDDDDDDDDDVSSLVIT